MRTLPYLLFLVILCSAFGAATPARALTRAGSSIVNRASGSYQDSGSGYFSTLQSNSVDALVQPLEAALLAPNQTVQVPAGAPISLAHRLQNVGNTPTQYKVSVQNQSGDDYDVSGLKITLDLNDNGVADVGEPELGALSPTIEQGDSISLVITGAVPGSAASGDTGKLKLSALSQNQSASATNTDTISVAGAAAFQVFKSASVPSAKAGDAVTFTLSALNRGSAAAQSVAVTVDNAPRSLIVLRDKVPANTSLRSIDNGGGGLALYHRAGDAPDTYLSRAPENLETVDAVAFAVPNFAPQSTLKFAFAVTLHRNISGELRNIAQLQFGQNGQPQSVDSNQVRVSVPASIARIQYFTNASFDQLTSVTGVGQPLYLEVDCASANQDPSVIERIRVTNTSQKTGDIMLVDAVETAPNSGIFRVVTTPIHGAATKIPGNGIVETQAGDTLTAAFVCDGQTFSATVLVDPFGVVYDSRTNAPVEGAVVTLIDVTGNGNGGRPGQPAMVFQIDGSVAPSVITVNAGGRFRFPRVAPSTYSLQVAPPTGYSFPSKLPPAVQPANRIVDGVASYGGNFTINTDSNAVQLDLPLDGPLAPTPATTGIFIEKAASRRNAEIGDFIDYEIHIRNTSSAALTALTISDTLPVGFKFQSGSARLGGATLTPASNTGRDLVFTLGNIAAGGEARFTYRVLAGVGTKIGRNTNTARATGSGSAGNFTSNVASASVEIQGGVFDEKGIVLGRVFVDSNGNDQFDAGEPGIAGVRVWVEDGTFVLTDEDGMYSIYGLEARTHVVKIDAATLPKGALFEAPSSRYAINGRSFFVDLKKGELRKINFLTRTATPALLDELKARRLVATHRDDEASTSLHAALSPDGALLLPGDIRALPASGMIGAGLLGTLPGTVGVLPGNTGTLPRGVGTLPRGVGTLPGAAGVFPGAAGVFPGAAGVFPGAAGVFPGATGVLNRGVGALNNSVTASNAPALNGDDRVFALNAGENGGVGITASANALPLNSANSNLPTSPVATAPSVNLEALLPTLKPELGFVDLKEGDTLALAQTNVRVKGAAGASFRLRANGIEIPATRVGLKASSDTVTAWEFVGVKLQAGKNELQVEQLDSFGLPRGSAMISVIAPGDLGRLEVGVPAKNAFADGRSLVKIGVRLTDAKGVAVSSRTAITLEATLGQWQVIDLNPREAGVQVFIEGGRAEFSLLAPTQAGTSAIRVSSGVLQSSARLDFVPELRPLIATGLVTAKAGLFGFKPSGASAVSTAQIFENEDATRGALFVKGRILGSSLLTLRYDSQKREDDRLFRDIQPDAFYPIYGDAGARGFDAQSTGRLYVRVDNQKSYALYGDYTTAALNPARSLGDYNRSMTGVKVHGESGKLSANAFASRDNQRQIVDEIRGNGTSGRYLLRAGDIREQSERVEIIVRDRNQPSVVLSTTPQTRFTDYTLDNFSQGLLFRAPVPSFDANLNPVFIRVSYEVDQGGPQFLVAGVDAQFRAAKNLEIGGAYTRDANPQDSLSLKSVNATVKIAAGTTLVGEWAQSTRGGALDGLNGGGIGGNLGGRGDAQRVELLHESGKLAGRVFYGRSDANFSNPASVLAQGREEASAKATYKLSGQSRIIAEAIHSKDSAGGAARDGAQLALQRSLANNVQVEVGVRKVKDSGALVQNGESEAADFTSLRAKISAPVPNMPQANLFAEYERAVQGDGQVLAIGGDYQIANRGRLYLRQELLSSLSGRYGLNDSSDQQSTLFGIDADYMKNGRVFSEYRIGGGGIGGGIGARDAQASIGLRNGWNLGEGLRLNTTFERIKDLGGLSNGVNGSSVAATGALEYTRNPDFKGTARLEVRRGSTDAILGTVGAAYKISPALSLLGKGVYNRTSSGSGFVLGTPTLPNGGSTFGVDLSGQNQRRAVIGLAYRSTTNDRLNALLKYEYRVESGALTTRLRRQAQIATASANYQASRNWNLSGRAALKSGYDASNDLGSRSFLRLISGRATYNLGRRTEVSLLGSYLNGNGASQFGTGAEVGFRLTSGIRLSAGYLLGHFRDDASSDVIGTDSGFYLRFGYEFDGDLGGLNP